MLWGAQYIDALIHASCASVKMHSIVSIENKLFCFVYLNLFKATETSHIVPFLQAYKLQVNSVSTTSSLLQGLTLTLETLEDHLRTNETAAVETIPLNRSLDGTLALHAAIVSVAPSERPSIACRDGSFVIEALAVALIAVKVEATEVRTRDKILGCIVNASFGTIGEGIDVFE